MVDPLNLPLRDVHAAPPVSWFPPAPGSLVLLAVLALAVAAAVLLLPRRIAAWRIRKAGSQELEDIRRRLDAGKLTPQQAAQQISVLLRRWLRQVDPTASVSATGATWVEELNLRLRQPVFSGAAGAALVEAPYRQCPPETAALLLDACEAALAQSHLPRRSRTTARHA